MPSVTAPVGGDGCRARGRSGGDFQQHPTTRPLTTSSACSWEASQAAPGGAGTRTVPSAPASRVAGRPHGHGPRREEERGSRLVPRLLRPLARQPGVGGVARQHPACRTAPDGSSAPGGAAGVVVGGRVAAGPTWCLPVVRAWGGGCRAPPHVVPRGRGRLEEVVGRRGAPGGGCARPSARPQGGRLPPSAGVPLLGPPRQGCTHFRAGGGAPPPRMRHGPGRG